MAPQLTQRKSHRPHPDPQGLTWASSICSPTPSPHTPLTHNHWPRCCSWTRNILPPQSIRHRSLFPGLERTLQAEVTALTRSPNHHTGKQSTDGAETANQCVCCSRAARGQCVSGVDMKEARRGGGPHPPGLPAPLFNLNVPRSHVSPPAHGVFSLSLFPVFPHWNANSMKAVSYFVLFPVGFLLLVCSKHSVMAH